ncbi:MAG: HAMP domain-containing sensor histidine kinase, partial [Candidatus Falkowbacteria bacterium]|nr:HAMP domain-containing sensor histidine kinase [Candidatus Falkowbacteria bacterium]
LESIKEKLMPWQKGFKIIEEGANRIGRVLSDFWIAYDLEGEKIKLVLERMDIKELIEMVIDEKKKMEIFKTKKLAINFTLPGFSPPLLLADHRRIAFVIASLLDNAIFYTDKGGVEISLALEKKGRTEFLKVYVTDTGAGMKEEDIPLLFKKFSRGTSASLLHPDGSGLRLYISKHIIEYSGGELKLEKTGLGKGSTFSFTLPLPANRKIQ